MSALAALSTRLKDWLNGKGAGNPLGVYASKINLGTRLNELAAIETGTLEITNGGTTGTATVAGAAGSAVIATINEAGSSALYIKSAVIAGTTLTVTVDQDPGTNLTIGYIIDGR